MMPEYLKRTFESYARLAVFNRRVDSARARVARWLERVEKPYVAFSAGKDSTCVLALVRERRDVPAVYFDADCSFSEVDAILNGTHNLIKHKADEPFLETLARAGLDHPRVEAITMETTVYGPVKRLIRDHGFDGVCYGLRAEESTSRYFHARRRGAIFRYKRDGVLACQPIYDWTYYDVWAFIVSRDLRYCGVYDRLWDAPVRAQRISYWAGESARQFGRYIWLKRNYPDLWHRLVEHIPEVTGYA